MPFWCPAPFAHLGELTVFRRSSASRCCSPSEITVAPEVRPARARCPPEHGAAQPARRRCGEALRRRVVAGRLMDGTSRTSLLGRPHLHRASLRGHHWTPNGDGAPPLGQVDIECVSHRDLDEGDHGAESSGEIPLRTGAERWPWHRRQLPSGAEPDLPSQPGLQWDVDHSQRQALVMSASTGLGPVHMPQESPPQRGNLADTLNLNSTGLRHR